MNQFTVLLGYLFGLPLAGFLGYAALERWMRSLDAKEKIKAELNELNDLQTCGGCGRLSRNYQRELNRCDLLFKGERLKGTTADSPLLPCPHCGEETDFLPITRSYNFHSAHPDCPPLEKQELSQYKRQLEQCEELLYYAKVNKAYRSRLLEENEKSE
ncbi:hypothetical protein QYG89_11100 [Bacillus sp. B190/17]|uniref:Uncharacterized protein n=1 Tax=Bacillus lumedeiriae TaxID=3058829 RepID=A0ABW8I9Q5_9BACI